MSILLVTVSWIVLSLVTTAAMALVCHGGAQEDRARALVPVPAPREATDDLVASYSGVPSQSLT